MSSRRDGLRGAGAAAGPVRAPRSGRSRRWRWLVQPGQPGRAGCWRWAFPGCGWSRDAWLHRRAAGCLRGGPAGDVVPFASRVVSGSALTSRLLGFFILGFFLEAFPCFRLPAAALRLKIGLRERVWSVPSRVAGLTSVGRLHLGQRSSAWARVLAGSLAPGAR